jgi:hypothetical protein
MTPTISGSGSISGAGSIEVIEGGIVLSLTSYFNGSEFEPVLVDDGSNWVFDVQVYYPTVSPEVGQTWVFSGEGVSATSLGGVEWTVTGVSDGGRGDWFVLVSVPKASQPTWSTTTPQTDSWTNAYIVIKI